MVPIAEVEESEAKEKGKDEEMT